jgi:HAD superfamily hydrolase (TIGR01490 family)
MDQHTTGYRNLTGTQLRTAAFFDLDRTLIGGSATFTVAVQARNAGLISVRRLLRGAVIASVFQVVGAGDGASDKIRQRVLQSVAGTRQSDLQALNEKVLPRLLERIRPEAQQQLDRHQNFSRDTFIISAAPQEIVGPLAEALGMTGGIGTRGAVADGRYTGELESSFCYGPVKRSVVDELAATHGYDLQRCFAYSDSISDLPMLEAVGFPVAVNPDFKLGRHSRNMKWPVIKFQSRTKETVRVCAASFGKLMRYFRSSFGRSQQRQQNLSKLYRFFNYRVLQVGRAV